MRLVFVAKVIWFWLRNRLKLNILWRSREVGDVYEGGREDRVVLVYGVRYILVYYYH